MKNFRYLESFFESRSCDDDSTEKLRTFGTFRISKRKPPVAHHTSSSDSIIVRAWPEAG